jgi:hypothetical protein
MTAPGKSGHMGNSCTSWRTWSSVLVVASSKRQSCAVLKQLCTKAMKMDLPLKKMAEEMK